MRILRKAPSLLWLITIAPGWAAEPLVGHWRLTSQQISGQERENPDPLLLRVTLAGNAFEFAYSVPINDIQFVAMKFTARLDGLGAEIKNAQGKTIGTAKVTKTGALQYRISIEGPSRPTASITMTVSADGKTLTSTSDSMAAGKNPATHTVQVFVRQ
jgi:hypothetical protein